MTSPTHAQLTWADGETRIGAIIENTEDGIVLRFADEEEEEYQFEFNAEANAWYEINTGSVPISITLLAP